jgi:hypothetical protein
MLSQTYVAQLKQHDGAAFIHEMARYMCEVMDETEEHDED